jgi:hypothetical protein
MKQDRLLSQAASANLLSTSGFGTTSCGTTFKDRVTRFWDWYVGAADRFFDTIEGGRCQDLTVEVAEFMRNTLPYLGWVFGPGKDGGHSFTLTGEGHVAKQLLAEYWQSRAVEIPNWTFFGSRQPSAAEKLKTIEIALGEQESINVAAVMLKTAVDEESKTIDLVAWHPALERVPEEHHYQILFLLLDEVLGEFGTQTWLGNIAIESIAPQETNKRLIDLPDFIEEVSNYYQWNKCPPLQSYAVYKVSEQMTSRRGDTVVGSTCIPNIIFEFLDNDGTLPEDPYEGLGAELAYVAFDSELLPEGRESDARGIIEDALNEALQGELSGRTLGGAFGIEESYIDLLLLDGENSHRIVQQTLNELQLSGRSRVESFA